MGYEVSIDQINLFTTLLSATFTSSPNVIVQSCIGHTCLLQLVILRTCILVFN